MSFNCKQKKPMAIIKMKIKDGHTSKIKWPNKTDKCSSILNLNARYEETKINAISSTKTNDKSLPTSWHSAGREEYTAGGISCCSLVTGTQHCLVC